MRPVLRPFPWALLGHLCLGIVLAPVLVVALMVMAVAVALARPLPVAFLLAARGFGALIALDRARFAVLQGRAVGHDLTPPDAALRPRERARAVLEDPELSRASGYAIIRLALSALELAVLTIVFTQPLLIVFALALAALTPYEPSVLGLVSNPNSAVVAVVALLLASVATPLLIRGLAWLDVWATVALLGVPESAELQRRVGELVEARARTVSAADAERLKLERDLHDGAQQRLIALSVLLGQAEARLTDADADTRALVRPGRIGADGEPGVPAQQRPSPWPRSSSLWDRWQRWHARCT